MKKNVLEILILLISMNVYSQDYWLPTFVNDFEGNHVNLTLAEEYLDKAIKEAQNSGSQVDISIPYIAREYFRIGLIKKGEQCKLLLPDNRLSSYNIQRIKGLSSSQDLEVLIKEIDGLEFWEKVYISERFVKDGRVEEGLRILQPIPQTDAQIQRVKEMLCEYIPNISEVGKFYQELGGNNDRPLLFELMNRIRTEEINLDEAKKVLEQLNLFNDRAKELLAYATGDFGDYRGTLKLIAEIEDKSLQKKAIVNLGGRKCSESKLIRDKICSINSNEANYECWKNKIKSMNHIKIDNNFEVI